jgi:cation transport ATPase
LLATIKPSAPSSAVQKANQSLAISSASLGLATAGWWLMLPALNLVSLPIVVYVFAPTFEAAYTAVVRERRVTHQVLDAVRVGVCVVMGYSLAATLNAVLQATSQRLLVRAEDRFHQELEMLFGQDQQTIWAYRNGVETAVSPVEATAGTVIGLTTGDAAPADGLVLYGAAWLDQRLATGDRGLVQIRAGDQVAVGSVVAAGQLYVQLYEAVQPLPAAAIRQVLAASAQHKSWTQRIGEAGAAGSAPGLLAIFALTLPLLGAERATAFLTLGFGDQLRLLGPHLVRQVIDQAAREGILIKDVRALEAATLVNTLVFDGRVLTNPTVRSQARQTIQALRKRTWLTTRLARHAFAAYVLLDEGDATTAQLLVAELGLDDYFLAAGTTARTGLIEQLQLGGRFVCYIGTGEHDDAVMDKATMTVAHRSLATLEHTHAGIVLLDNDLGGLEQIFTLAATFTAKQGFNLITPIGLDLVNLSTSVLFHFGLTASLLFSYTGLLLGIAVARFAPPNRKPEHSATANGLALLVERTQAQSEG